MQFNRCHRRTPAVSLRDTLEHRERCVSHQCDEEEICYGRFFLFFFEFFLRNVTIATGGAPGRSANAAGAPWNNEESCVQQSDNSHLQL